ncbi:Peptide-N(4)-(N-acetyl-beta-glucosaminyl)asparagine amidase [Blattella germanica]|nr:Peptide-N(4)-(N-acetyl-beta-glucosaminyl)asparagine amidase [Blattella germanica]
MTKGCVLSLEENPEELYLETTSVLLRLVDNVIKDPSNPKYRSIRLGNPTVANKLLPAVGAMECLFEMGFKEGEDSLVLPSNTSLENLRSIRNEISERRSSYKNPHSKVDEPAKKTAKTENASSSSSKAITTSAPVRQTSQMQLSQQKSKRPFLQRVAHHFQAVLRYEDKDLQAKALALIPCKDLETAAEKNMRQLQKAIKNGKTEEQEIDIQEFVYKCNTCQKQTLFPRYNDPEKLLETRKGRCGEWANCFTLLCRSLDFDARYVADETDHVWTEVYFGTRKRWLHCDPCENICDSPLIYEAGWGKKLSYVMAYSKDEIQDVTWRYSCKHHEVMGRRTQCTEKELLNFITDLRRQRQESMSKSKQLYLNKRLLTELVEFLTPREPTEEEKKGRGSGSLTWRLARGETQVEMPTEPFVWKPTQGEITEGKMHIQYSSSKNVYQREDGKQELQGWEKGVFHVNSVFRKEEKDWKMTYLARTEKSESGSISWKFDVTGTGVVVDTVQLAFSSQLYETGKVRLRMCADETCTIVPNNGKVFETDIFQGTTHLELTAYLEGGSGDNAWQHAQLFRQEMTNNEDYPFDIVIKLKKV